MTAEERAGTVLDEWENGPLTTPMILDVVADAIRAAEQAARDDEREACAKVADNMADLGDGTARRFAVSNQIAAAIRARK